MLCFFAMIMVLIVNNLRLSSFRVICLEKTPNPDTPSPETSGLELPQKANSPEVLEFGIWNLFCTA
jgi:hypothetical protein